MLTGTKWLQQAPGQRPWAEMKKKPAVAALPSSWLLPVMASGCVMVRRTFPPLPSKITKPFQGNWCHLYFWTREGAQHNDGGSRGTRAYTERGLSVSFASDSQAARLVVFPNTHLGVAVKVCFFMFVLITVVKFA